MNIIIKTIPNNEQRPEVDGCDWFFDGNGDLQVRVSPMSDWRYEALLGIHEAVEAIMCKHNGVTQRQVDEFDGQFARAHAVDVNAGDDPQAPYKREHCLATAVERILCAELEVDWKAYDDELCREYPNPNFKPATTPDEAR